MKKSVACLLALLMALVPLLALAEAEETGIGLAYVLNPEPSERLNLRSAPESGDNVIGRYYTGTVVTKLEAGESFTKVKVGPLTGYMQNTFLSDTRVDWTPGDWGTVNVPQSGEGVNVRKEANKDSISHGLFFNGSVFQILEDGEEYYKVRGLNIEGYTLKQFMIMDGSFEKPVYTALYWGRVDADKANLHCFPSEEAASMGTYDKGQMVKIIQAVGTWYYVEIYGESLDIAERQRGFIPAQNLHVGNYNTATGTPEGICAVVRTPNENERLPVRVEAASSSDVLLMLINTSQVLLLDKSYEMGDTFMWWPVQVGDTTGFVQSRFLDVVDQRAPDEWE